MQPTPRTGPQQARIGSNHLIHTGQRPNLAAKFDVKIRGVIESLGTRLENDFLALKKRGQRQVYVVKQRLFGQRHGVFAPHRINAAGGALQYAQAAEVGTDPKFVAPVESGTLSRNLIGPDAKLARYP